MKSALLLLLAAPLCAQVNFKQSPGKIDVEIGGKPFTTFYAGGDAPKPYLAPLNTADGMRITRVFPMGMVEGETRDHPHHRGLWFTHGDVNKIDFWMNEPNYPARHGTINLDRIDLVKGGKKQGTIKATFTWNTDKGQPLIREDRTMVFHNDPAMRIVDFDVTFTALDKAVFGDTKEGFFAIRLRDELTETKGTGRMTSADGKSGMKQVWGSRSPWVDFAGTLEGKKIGVAIFDHPGNIVHPTYWHARDYGLFAANPFGLHDFLNDKTKDGSYTLEKGKTVRFRYRVVIHPGDNTDAHIAKMYADWAKSAK